jgi:hypothetical protein
VRLRQASHQIAGSAASNANGHSAWKCISGINVAPGLEEIFSCARPSRGG